MRDELDGFDWSVTTWEGSRRAQLRHALALTLRERMEALEGLADVARRFQEMRERGEFTYPSGEPAPANAPSIAQEPSPPHDKDSQ